MKKLIVPAPLLALGAALALAACSQNAQNESAEAGNALAADTEATTANAVTDVDAATDNALGSAEREADQAGASIENATDDAGAAIANGADAVADATGNTLSRAGAALKD